MRVVVVDVYHRGKDPFRYSFLISEAKANLLDESDPLANIDDKDYMSPFLDNVREAKKWAKDHRHTVAYVMEAVGY